MANTDGYRYAFPIFKFALREDLKNDEMFLPTQVDSLATGYDVRAAPVDRQDIIINAGEYFKIPLGFRSFCPSGWWYQLHPRSSSFTKKHIHNLIGTVDESWEGETLFAGQFLPDINGATSLTIKFGEAIGQLIPCERQVMIVKNISNADYDDLCNKRNGTRKTGGFGSSG